jgi:putative transposase
MDERKQFIEAWLKRDTDFAALCRAFGISRKSGYKWTSRFTTLGEEGLRDRPPIAGSHPLALPLEQVAWILSVRKRHPFWGPRKIRAWLEEKEFRWEPPAASTIGSILKRHGYVRDRRRRRSVAPATQPFAACAAPNATWCADFKGHFLLGNGRRCHPLTITDAFSRYLLRCEGLNEPRAEPVHRVFDQCFVEFGLPAAIRTDNGPPFATLGAGALSRLAVWWIKLGIRPDRIEPGKPQQNGRHERMHRTLKAETASPPQRTMVAQQLAFDRFRAEFNEVRPHEALGQKPPASVHAHSPRSYPCPLSSPEYASGSEVRVVDHNGSLKWRGTRFFVSESLAHEPVGFTEAEAGKWEAHYGPVLLGILDERGREPVFVRPRRQRTKVLPKLPV